MLALVGFARTLLVVRLLTLEEYALIGVVEAVRTIVETLFGLALSDSLAREGSVETNKHTQGIVVTVAYVNSIALAFFSGLGFLLAIVFSENLISDSRLPTLLLLAFVASLFDRLWLIAITVLQISGRYRAALVSTFVYGLSIAAVMVWFVWLWGVHGYLLAQILVLVICFPTACLFAKRIVEIPNFRTLVASWRTTSIRLWGLSWSMYTIKGSGVLWRRVPILLMAPFASQQIVGVVSAALDLSNKIHLIQQALSPLIVPRLTRALAVGGREFSKLARTELLQIGVINLLALVIAVVAWALFGSVVIGAERWTAIGLFFYVALVVEITLVVAHVTGICVLIPTNTIKRIAAGTIVIRLLTIPIFFACIALEKSTEIAVFASLLLSGSLVACLFLVTTMRTLSRMHGVP